MSGECARAEGHEPIRAPPASSSITKPGVERTGPAAPGRRCQAGALHGLTHVLRDRAGVVRAEGRPAPAAPARAARICLSLRLLLMIWYQDGALRFVLFLDYGHDDLDACGASRRVLLRTKTRSGRQAHSPLSTTRARTSRGSASDSKHRQTTCSIAFYVLSDSCTPEAKKKKRKRRTVVFRSSNAAQCPHGIVYVETVQNRKSANKPEHTGLNRPLLPRRRC